MRLAVFGSTGHTGQFFVQNALDKGHEVIAFSRDPEKMNIKDERLQVVQVNIFVADDILQYVTDCDAVVSCLGSDYQFFKDITLYSDSAKAIVGAMRRTECKRFVFISSWLIDDSPDLPWTARFIIRPWLHRTLTDMRRMELYFMNECPDINYTSIRPPGLAYRGMDGRDLLVEPDVDFSTSMKQRLPRRDLAKFILRVVEENCYIRKRIAVGLPQ